MTNNIWPRALPQSVLEDPRRNSEVRVYNRLKAGLDNSFHVYYSGPWLATDQFGNEVDGECDFLVAHRELGILAIEVKGGGISYDPKSSQWLSIDRHGFRHRIKDPVNQARSAKHNILRKLKSSRLWKEKWIRTRHGVIFPDAATPPRDLGADRPARLFCCSKELSTDLKAWVFQRMDEGKEDRRAEPLGADGILALEKMFVQRFTLGFHISAAMSADMETLGLLEPTQYHIIDSIQDIQRALIHGGAGTGKSVIAVEEALRAGQRGERTLLTCYNGPLGRAFEHRLEDASNVDVGSFHAICRRIALQAGLNITAETSDSEWFDRELPNLLVEAIAKRPELRWNTIVVDEGQDITENWWLAIEEALLPDGKLRVFVDQNQKVYGDRNKLVSDLSSIPIRLIRNLRNTQRIHNAASLHYDGPTIVAEGPEGAEIDWHAIDGDADLGAAAYKVFRDLVYKQTVDPGEIAILFSRKAAIDSFKKAAARTELEFATAGDLYSEHAILDTVRRFKGLERPAIILAVGNSDMTQTEIAYVGMTRAKVYLAVLSSKAGQQLLRQGIVDGHRD